jgi:histidinol-phosphate aminotransferase
MGFEFPTKKVIASVTPNTRLIAIANPNNPTGMVVNRRDLLALADAAPQAALLVDEAYYDFFGETVIDAIARFSNLFIARTFSKAYGLAGLRAGALAGNAAQMKLVRKVSSPYNVNAVALACLPAAIADREFVQAYAREAVQGRARLMVQLAYHGVPYWISHANFVLAKIGPLHREFVLEMRNRGILVRDRSNDPGCDGCVRMTVGASQHTDRLLLALPQVLSAIGWTAPAAQNSAKSRAESAQ